MKFITTTFIEYEKSLQAQDDNLPIWLSSKERPKFEWSEVYPKEGNVINYYKDPITGQDNFDECSEQLKLLFDYIIQIDRDKFKNLWDLRNNINNNLIISKDQERANPEAPKVSDLNVRAVFSQIKPTLEKYLLMLKYENNILSKEEIENYVFTACFSGASSNLNGMMELFHRNKITAHAYRAFKDVIRQRAIEFCRNSGIIDHYNYGNEIHYVNYFVNKILWASNLKQEIDELIPAEDSFLIEKLQSFISKGFKTKEIIYRIIMQWPLFDKKSWSYDDIITFFSYYENTEKSIDDEDVNYWQIMFELDETTNTFIPKNNINQLYTIYISKLFSKEKLLELSYINISYQNETLKILKNSIDGRIILIDGSVFSLFKDNKNFKNIIFENIDNFSFNFCIRSLFKNFDKEDHFLLTKKLIEMNHPYIHEHSSLLRIYENLNLNDLTVLLEESHKKLLFNFLLKSIFNSRNDILHAIYDISLQSEIVNNKIKEIIEDAIDIDNIDFILPLANRGLWSVNKDYILELCLRGIYEGNINLIIYAINFPEINSLSDEQISNIVMATINEGKWILLDSIFSSTNILSIIKKSLAQIFDDLFDNYIIKENDRELIFVIISQMILIKYRNVKTINSISKNIAKLFSSGLIEDGLKIFNFAHNNDIEEKVIFYFMRQTMNHMISVNNNQIQNKPLEIKYNFELSLKNLNATQRLFLEYLTKKKIKRLSYDEDNKAHLNYYIAMKIVLGLCQPGKMNFLLDFKLKEANEYINKFLNLNLKDIDPELQSIIDQAKSWKRRKSPIKN